MSVSAIDETRPAFGGSAMSPRRFMTLLLHGSKVSDVLATALRLGLLDALDRGPVTLRALCESTGARPLRLYKFLDVLESAGLVRREELTEQIDDARYVSEMPLRDAAEEVFGDASIERDRERWPWQSLHGKLEATLRGEHSIPREEFAWPPEGGQVAAFEASMSAGILPIVETFAQHADEVLGPGDRACRLLDVGGGDGALGAALLESYANVHVDVFNLPAVEPLVRKRSERLGFVGGDFLADELPRGWDVLTFVRVLHDWPPEVAMSLLRKAFDALPSGGRVVVCEEFRDAERLAVQLFWTYFLIGVDGCVSRLREVEWYVTRLSSCGFRDVRVLGGAPFELVVATKP